MFKKLYLLWIIRTLSGSLRTFNSKEGARILDGYYDDLYLLDHPEAK